jgi:hypothetical protein
MDPKSGRNIFRSCWKSTHDSSVSSPYPSHYIDCAIPGPTSFLIVSILSVFYKISFRHLPSTSRGKSTGSYYPSFVKWFHLCIVVWRVCAHICILCLSTWLFTCVLLILALLTVFRQIFAFKDMWHWGATLGCQGGHYEVCSSVLWCHVIR